MVSCLGSPVQSCCGEGGALQTNVTGVCGEHSQRSHHTGFSPTQRHVCFPRLHYSGFRLLYMEQALSCVRFQFSGTPQKRGLSCACILCLPHRSSSGSLELDRCTLPGAVRLLPSAVPASVSVRSGQMCLVSVLRNWPLAATLPADVDHPESQEVFG